MNITPWHVQNIFAQPKTSPYKNIRLNKAPATDVFQKITVGDVNFTGVEKQRGLWSEEKITQVFDKTYEKAVLDNPIINKMNITKPELVFEDENDDYLAGYMFVMNHISISPYMKDPFSLIAFVDDEGKIKEPVGVVPDTTLESYDKYFEQNKNLVAINLTDEEKEAYVKSAFAHELRHWVQTHLVASTQGVSNLYLSKVKSGAQDMKIDFKMMKDFMDKAGENTRRITEDIGMLDYAIQYEPKELLEKNTKLKFSLHPKDTRYFSVTKHFAKSLMDDRAKTGSEGYRARPHEADAFNYQFEFFNENIKNETAKGAKKEILSAISLMLYRDAYRGLQIMPEYGYEPLIFE